MSIATWRKDHMASGWSHQRIVVMNRVEDGKAVASLAFCAGCFRSGPKPESFKELPGCQPANPKDPSFEPADYVEQRRQQLVSQFGEIPDLKSVTSAIVLTQPTR